METFITNNKWRLNDKDTKLRNIKEVYYAYF